MKDLPGTWGSLGGALLAVAALAVAAYSAAPASGFVLDDDAAIAHNPAVTQPSLRAVVTRDFRGGTPAHPRADAYRPLTSATFALDWRGGGGLPALFHVTNLAWHVVACCAVLLGLWSAEGMRRRAALAAASLFALHPLHTDAVASIVGRADVIGALFVLVVFWLHRRADGWATLAAPLVLFAALLAKESSVVAVPLLVLVELRRESFAGGGARLVRWLGYAAAIAAALTLRAAALGSWHAPPPNSCNPLLHASTASRTLTGLSLFARALQLFVLPFDLVPDYGRAVVVPLHALDGRVLAGAASLLALVALAAWAWRRPGPLLDAIAFVLVPGVLSVGLVVPLPGAFAERWWYLPSLGLCVLAALLLDFVALRVHAFIPGSVLAVTLVVFALVTHRRTAEWRDDETLFTTCVITAPSSALCQYGLGAIRDAQQADGEALQRYQQAETLDPGWAEPHAAAAAILARQGRIAEAQAAFDKMKAAGGASAIGRLNYARFLLRTGRLADGQRELDSLHEVNRNEPQ